MELKIKYEYTYFIKPFLIKEDKYEKYILSLLNNKDFSLKIFEKERDLNLYSYFMQNVREYFFPTFSFGTQDLNNLKILSNEEKSKMLSKYHCNIFEYSIKNKPQGKIEKEDGIFFNIDKIELICFDSGICFLLIKTYIENSNSFLDLLNFNYKFKDINTNYSNLKEYNNIKIQTDEFGNMTLLSEFIDKIVGINTDILINELDLYNKRFFTYTYCCIDQENWNKEEDFVKIENDFIKFTNILSGNSILNFNTKDLKGSFEEYNEFKYAKFGFTKQSASLLTSSIDMSNYTKILFDFENEYLYTLIISLYQRLFIKKLEIDFNNNIEKAAKNFYKFTKEIWYQEITNSVTGTMYYNKWKKIFELNEIYKELKNKYEVVYKKLNIENNSKTNKVILIALITSLILNILNFIAIFKLL